MYNYWANPSNAVLRNVNMNEIVKDRISNEGSSYGRIIRTGAVWCCRRASSARGSTDLISGWDTKCLPLPALTLTPCRPQTIHHSTSVLWYSETDEHRSPMSTKVSIWEFLSFSAWELLSIPSLLQGTHPLGPPIGGCIYDTVMRHPAKNSSSFPVSAYIQATIIRSIHKLEFTSKNCTLFQKFTWERRP